LAHRALELRAATLVELLERADAFRRPARFAQALLAFEADARGRTGLEAQPYPQSDWLRQAREAAAAVRPEAAELAGLNGAAVGAEIRRRRIEAVASLARPATMPSR
jgi:tRNA nucleotidyltransferase (CCA-adding enzyme)